MAKKYPRTKAKHLLKVAPLTDHTVKNNGNGTQHISAEQQVQISDELQEPYRSLVTTDSQFFWKLTAQGQVEEDVPGWRAFTGQSKKDIMGMGWLKALHPEDAKRFAAVQKQALRARVFYEQEFRIRRFDGVYRTLVARGLPVFAKNGSIQQWIGVCTDITERKELEGKLHNSEQKFRATFEQAAVGIAHVSTDGRWLLINQKLCDILGYTNEELQQTTFHSILLKDDFLHHAQAAEALFSGKITSYANEERYKRKDGSLIWASATVTLGHSIANHPPYFIAVIEDISKRKKAEQQTYDAMEALLAMAESLVRVPDDDDDLNTIPEVPPDDGTARQLAKLTCRVLSCRSVGLLTLDTPGDVLLPVAVAGSSVEHKQHWWKTQKDQRNTLHESFTGVQIEQLQNNQILLLQMEKAQLHNLLAPYPTRMMLVAPMIVNEQLVGLFILDHGDTEHAYPKEELVLAQAVARLAALVIERRRLMTEHAEMQAREMAQRAAKESMEEFLSIASHELKTPLTMISVNLQVIERLLTHIQGQETIDIQELTRKIDALQEMLKSAHRQVSMLNRLVGDMIDISRIQSNKFDLHLRPKLCDLSAIVQETVNSLQQVNPGRDIRLSIKYMQRQQANKLPTPIGQDEILMPVFADADRVSQVVTNYLTNALKYSPEQKPIEVRLQLAEDHVRVAVRDHGPGLTAEEQEHIWERFYQVSRVEKQNNAGAGLGLGLHISRSIIERHKGNVGIQSTVGEGSTFWFTLPLIYQLD